MIEKFRPFKTQKVKGAKVSRKVKTVKRKKTKMFTIIASNFVREQLKIYTNKSHEFKTFWFALYTVLGSLVTVNKLLQLLGNKCFFITLLKQEAACKNNGRISCTSPILRVNCLYKISVPLFANFFVTSWVTRINMATQYRQILIWGSSSVEHCWERTWKLFEAANNLRWSSSCFAVESLLWRKPEI